MLFLTRHFQMRTMSGHESEVLGFIPMHTMCSEKATLPVSHRGCTGFGVGAVGLSLHFMSGDMTETPIQVSTPSRRAIVAKDKQSASSGCFR